MQSIEILIVIAGLGAMLTGVSCWGVQKRKSGATSACTASHRFSLGPNKKRRLLVVLGLQHFATTVEAVRADVVTQVGFTGGWLDCQLRSNQEIVRTVHTALRWGLLVLLNCHDDS
jgi:hypothetical protein